MNLVKREIRGKVWDYSAALKKKNVDLIVSLRTNENVATIISLELEIKNYIRDSIIDSVRFYQGIL